MATVYMDVGTADQSIGRMTFELYDEVVPKTTENFRQLCMRKAGEGYPGSPFHRIIPGFMVQGGDFTRGDGTGGRSIYGEKFADESFQGRAGRHTGFGTLSMANSGRDTNGSQLFITTGETPWLDGKHVVFGKLVDGADVLRRLETYGSPSGKTSANVMVLGCGRL